MRYLHKNQRVNIIFDNAEGEKIISCYVKEVFPDRIVLTQPQDWQKYLDVLQEGEEVKTRIFTRLGVLLYTTLILESPENDEFTLEYNEDLAEVQQNRRYVRVPMETAVDCEYDVIVNPQNPNEMVEFSTPLQCEVERLVVEATTVDIGGGGLKIETEKDLPFDKTITFKINLFDDIIVAQGVLVSKFKTTSSTFQYGVKFTKIKEDDKDKIIKICFKIDSLLNRKHD